MTKLFEVELNSYSQLGKFAELGFGFVYRGQADSRWELSSSLERAIAHYQPTIKDLSNKEYWMLHDFRQKLHLYSPHYPEHDNKFEWLALLQHHGCPTRLLDFSESIYIAAYFAVAESVQEAAIWAVSKHDARDLMIPKFSLPYTRGQVLKDAVNQLHVELINKIVGVPKAPEAKPHLIPLSSNKWSERLSRQQGTFLAPADLGTTGAPKTFMDNLMETFRESPDEVIGFTECDVDWLLSHLNQNRLKHKVMGIKIRISVQMQKQIRRHLNMMGINEEGLFPGLDGLARSMRQKIWD